MEKLTVLWTTDSIETIESMLVPYCSSSLKNEWWDEVRIIIWGKSTKSSVTSKEIQNYIKLLVERGIQIEACKFCSDKYGATDLLESLGVIVKYTGKSLTDYLKEDGKFISL